jgi:hypothetical protein
MFQWQDEQPTEEEMRAVRQAIELCRDEGRRVSIPTVKGDGYAYPASSGKEIIYGINGGSKGFCIAQGRTTS